MQMVFPLGKGICFIRDEGKSHVFITKTAGHTENNEMDRVIASSSGVEDMNAKNDLQSSILTDKDAVKITFTLKGGKK